MSSIHHAAAEGYATKADNYVRGRPDYPVGIDKWLRTRLGLGPGKVVIDLGAGTGKFTPRLVATGARAIAVEPVPQMLARLTKAYPEIETHVGVATSIPLPDDSVDAVVCAQAFHWFATKAALAGICRVLKPGGKLGLVWNVRDERVGWVARLADIMAPYAGDTPRYHQGDWKKVFPHEGFGPLQEEHSPHGHTGTPEDVIINRVLSTSFIASLPAEQAAQVAAQLRALIAAEPTLSEKDTVTLPYETAAFFCEKLP